jgi:hypothetical protein
VSCIVAALKAITLHLPKYRSALHVIRARILEDRADGSSFLVAFFKERDAHSHFQGETPWLPTTRLSTPAPPLKFGHHRREIGSRNQSLDLNSIDNVLAENGAPAKAA